MRKSLWAIAAVLVLAGLVFGGVTLTGHRKDEGHANVRVWQVHCSAFKPPAPKGCAAG